MHLQGQDLADDLFFQLRAVLRWRGLLRSCPDFPLTGVSHDSIRPQTPPGQSGLLRCLKTGERPQDPTANGQRLRQGLSSPTEGEPLSTAQRAGRIAELERRAGGHQLQWCVPQMVLKGHPEHGLGSVNGRRCRHGPVRQGLGVRSLASGQQTGRGECRRKGTKHDRA